MARQLWLLRHADAEPHGTRPDAERQLTERGRRQARVAGVALARTEVVFGAILTSPKARARETAELALAQMSESQSGSQSESQREAQREAQSESQREAQREAQKKPPRQPHGESQREPQSNSQSGSLELHPPLAGGFRAEQALEALAGMGSDGPLLLVGHEPDLSGIVGELTGGRVDLKKGGLAVVKLGAGGAELVLLLRPAELALIADVAVDDI